MEEKNNIKRRNHLFGLVNYHIEKSFQNLDSDIITPLVDYLTTISFDLNKDCIMKVIESIVVEEDINKIKDKIKDPKVLILWKHETSDIIKKISYINVEKDFAARRLTEKYGKEFWWYTCADDICKQLFYRYSRKLTKEEIQFCVENQKETDYINKFFLNEQGREDLTKKQIKHLEDQVREYDIRNTTNYISNIKKRIAKQETNLLEEKALLKKELEDLEELKGGK